MRLKEQVERGIFAYFSPAKDIREALLDSGMYPGLLPYKNQFKTAFRDSEDQPGGNPDIWKQFCMDAYGKGTYDFFNFQYVNTLANYLEDRANGLGATPEAPISLVGVRTITNRLFTFLEPRLGQGELIEYSSAKDHIESLRMDPPDIILCEWMPEGEDWSADFRNIPSVREYILIGATEEYCGEAWKTWGIRLPDNPHKDEEIPYIREGFELVDLQTVSQNQGECWEKPCYLDESPDQPIHSRTISFRREPKPQMIQLPLL